MKAFVLIGVAAVSIYCGNATAQVSSKNLQWPAPPQQARIQYLNAFSSETDLGVERSFLRKIWDWIIGADERAALLVRPLGITSDKLGRIYVADPGSRCVHVFDTKEKKYSKLSETEEGTLQSPVGIALGPDGSAYVTDSELQKVFVYDADGDLAFSIDGPFRRPTGIAIFHQQLFVTDTEMHRVLVFDLKGRFLKEIGKRGDGLGEFNFPVFMAARQELCVVDAMNHRIQLMDDSGKVRTAFGEIGNVQGTFANPKGIALDSDGNIYVADALFDAVQIFDSDGRLLLVFGHSGSGPGEFSMPSGVTIDEQDRVYVADALNRRIQVFQYVKGQ